MLVPSIGQAAALPVPKLLNGQADVQESWTVGDQSFCSRADIKQACTSGKLVIPQQGVAAEHTSILCRTGRAVLFGIGATLSGICALGSFMALGGNIFDPGFDVSTTTQLINIGLSAAALVVSGIACLGLGGLSSAMSENKIAKQSGLITRSGDGDSLRLSFTPSGQRRLEAMPAPPAPPPAPAVNAAATSSHSSSKWDGPSDPHHPFHPFNPLSPTYVGRRW